MKAHWIPVCDEHPTGAALLATAVMNVPGGCLVRVDMATGHTAADGFTPIDEPMPAGTYEELRPRLLKYGGTMRINFTPVPNMPDMTWLRGLIDRGVIEHPALSLVFVPRVSFLPDETGGEWVSSNHPGFRWTSS